MGTSNYLVVYLLQTNAVITHYFISSRRFSFIGNCVVLYWRESEIRKETRHMRAFTWDALVEVKTVLLLAYSYKGTSCISRGCNC